VQVGVSQKGLELLIGPVGFAVRLFVVIVAAESGILIQLLVEIFPGSGFGQGRHGRKGVEDRALAQIAAELGLDQNDGRYHLGVHAELLPGRAQDVGVRGHVNAGFVDPTVMGHLAVVQLGLVVLEIGSHASGFEDDLLVAVKLPDAPRVVTVGDKPLLQRVKKRGGPVVGVG